MTQPSPKNVTAAMRVAARWVRATTSRLYYHGTSSTHLDSIKAKGLVGDPQQRVWGGSLTAVKGFVYLTTDINIAVGYALDAVSKFGGDPLIIVVELDRDDPRIMADEDIIPKVYGRLIEEDLHMKPGRDLDLLYDIMDVASGEAPRGVKQDSVEHVKFLAVMNDLFKPTLGTLIDQYKKAIKGTAKIPYTAEVYLENADPSDYARFTQVSASHLEEDMEKGLRHVALTNFVRPMRTLKFVTSGIVEFLDNAASASQGVRARTWMDNRHWLEKRWPEWFGPEAGHVGGVQPTVAVEAKSVPAQEMWIYKLEGDTRIRSYTDLMNKGTRVAAIQHAPRDLTRYLSSMTKKLSKAETDLGKAFKMLMASRYGEDMGYWLKETSNYEFDYGDLGTLYGLYKLKLEGLARKVEGDANFIWSGSNQREKRQGLDWLYGTVEWAAEYMERFERVWDSLARNIGDMTEGFTYHGYNEDLPRGMPDALSKVAPAFRLIFKTLNDAKPKLGELVEMTKARGIGQDEYRPSHEDVETLYHATTEAKALKQKGFQSGAHRPGLGLGGGGGLSQGQAGISFTSDLHIAKEIMRVFKEVKMIADGKVKAHDIMDWARRANIADKLSDSYKGLRGKDWTDAQTPGEVFALFESYLAYSNRYNPVFWQGDKDAFMRKFKALNRKDIGILVADVDMTHPDIMYFGAEREFRVPPEAVLDIKKVIQ